MHAPISGRRNKRSVQIALNLHSYPVHMQRYQSRRLAPAVHVRLVARNVRIVHDFRVGHRRVQHRSLRQVPLRRRPGHRRRRSRSRLFTVEYALGEADAVLDAAGELAGHVTGESFPAMVVYVRIGH